MYVTSDLIGGLGNQLFQICTAIAYSITYDKQLFFLNKKELPCPGSTTRYTYWDSFLKCLSHLLTDNPPNTIKYNENTRNNNFELHYNNANIELNGFFQSYKYFDKYKSEILNMLQIGNTQQIIKNEYSNYFINKKYKVSIHFRLGDYKNIQHYHPIMSEKYYIDSITAIVNRLCITTVDIEVLYFCEKEDIETVNNKINIIKQNYPNIEFIRVSDDIDDWKQMIIMSLCDSNIIANSSFSWWGAYFNNNIHKIVTYPSVWFGKNVNIDRSNMSPSEWIKIN